MVLDVVRKLLGIGARARVAEGWPAQFRPRVEGLEDRLLLSRTWLVDDGVHKVAGAQFHSIQAAINAAAAGDTLNVSPGYYVQQLIIRPGKDNLQIIGLGSQTAIIRAPAVLGDLHAIVRITGAHNVTLKNFTIEGPGTVPGNLMYGIRVDNGGSATIQGNHITHIRDATFSNNFSGVGVLVGRNNPAANDVTVGIASIIANNIDDYQKAGIVVANNGSSATIVSNTIVGQGWTNVNAQYGIEIGYGATARVSLNAIYSNRFAGTSTFAAGLLVINALGVTADQNSIAGNQAGIYVWNTARGYYISNWIHYNWIDGIFLVGSGSNTIVYNSIGNNARDGIRVNPDAILNYIGYNTLTWNAEFDARDDSYGYGTGDTNNTWTGNFGYKQEFSGLLANLPYIPGT
jgi:parallel beta-helix repeat protein